MQTLESLSYLLRLDVDTYDATLPPAIVQRMSSAAQVIEQFETLQNKLQALAKGVESLVHGTEELQRENERLSQLVPPVRII
jgi:7-keto-8-aminopelargonate synthetase-like enzyme